MAKHNIELNDKEIRLFIEHLERVRPYLDVLVKQDDNKYAKSQIRQNLATLRKLRGVYER